MKNPSPAGPWRIANYVNYVTSDYLFPIPKAWADRYLSGMCLATGRYRDGGQGAQGPAILAIARARGVPLIEDAACAIGAEILWDGKWERIGLVTDHAGYRRAIKAFGFMMPGEVKVFDLAHRADAEAWVSE